MSKEESLLAAIKAETKNRVSGRKPMMFDAIRQLSAKEQTEFWEAVNDMTISAPAIARVMQVRGVRISSAAINKFRRGEYVHEHQ